MPAALVSIHDVMPETLADVRALLARLERRRIAPVMLLVVPGRDWSDAAIRELRAWQDDGHQLAGHGWHHHVTRLRGLRQRLHGALLSRHCAEHLPLAAADIRRLMRRNHAWFAEHDLRPPLLYVPPAWALGALPPRELAGLPFPLVETLGGVHDVRRGRFHRLPVIGFEADTRLRAFALRLANGAARMLVRQTGLLRVAIHPADARLHLARDLDGWLHSAVRITSYAALGEADAGTRRTGTRSTERG